ncbi:MAG TPA: DUF6600 domain-containing protein [Rhodanobacteraceae bacterium]|nr:DUF6600 domain-containing protein [Rhodanobacteraceae bacterium]
MSSIRLFHIRLTRPLLVGFGVCALLLGAAVQAQQYDNTQPYEPATDYGSQGPSADYGSYDQAPGRVARMAYLSGQVQFAPAGENNWGSVEINRPMVIGDRLLTGDAGRAVLELGDASVRIDHDSAFDFLNLAQDNVQIELSQGTLNLAVRHMAQGANFEVDTPTIAFVAATPGVFRIDNDPDGTGSMVTVFQGSGTVYGENGASRQVVAGTSYRFNDSTLASVDLDGLPQPDDFDRFCETRDSNYDRYAEQPRQYVPPEMIGGDDLYQYGRWDDTPAYGNVWYPSSVPAGWAPYRYGHWAWIEPWGWTWVDDQPWGFAPFHYGRWVYISNRWGWLPGPLDVRPVYAPALVAFIGGSGFSLSLNFGGSRPVGWFPLGPRDVYMPWFHASRSYFTRVNVTNIRNVYVNKTVINNFYDDYRAGRVPPRGGHDYAYRTLPVAVTAVPRNVFTDARPVHPAVLKLDRNELARTRLALRPDVNPGKASLGLRRPVAKPATLDGREPFTRPVVARHQPPPRPVEFAARRKVIASQHGQPPTPAQLQELRKTRPDNGPRNERVKLVREPAADAAGNAAITALRRDRAIPSRPSEPSARRGDTMASGFRNTVRPIPARSEPTQPARRPDELPSARFAHPGQPTVSSRAPAVRPAEPQRVAAPGRSPVTRSTEFAPRRIDDRALRQAQAGPEIRQRLGAQQARPQDQQQQRAREQQAQQQRAREQQAQQQRQAQVQAQQYNREQAMQQQMQQQRREQQVQQQRRAQVQAQQYNREQAMQQQQQMQQQRAMQMQAQRHAAEMQRQPQVRGRDVQRVAQPRNASEPEGREPRSRKHPPDSSGNRIH